MIIKGHILPFFSTSGKGYFLSEQNVLLKDFPAYANQVTTDIISHVENMAAHEKCPLIYLTSPKASKEQIALQILIEQPVDEGLICILSVEEYCQTLQPKKHDNGLLSLDIVNRKYKYYYFYFLDKHFGFMHVKLQTWFTFLIQIYINGREMMKTASLTRCMITLLQRLATSQRPRNLPIGSIPKASADSWISLHIK